MKNVIASFAAIFLLSIVSLQTAFGGTLPPEEGAVPIGTFTTFVNAADAEPTLKVATPDNQVYMTDKEYTASVSTTAWMVSSGETVYTLDVNTAEFYMPCGWAKQLALPAMMDMFSQAAIKQGIELGFTQCSSDCGANISKVFFASCLKRLNGQECPTLIASPEAGYNMNAYDVCCATGYPQISLLYTVCNPNPCGSGYQPTC